MQRTTEDHFKLYNTYQLVIERCQEINSGGDLWDKYLNTIYPNNGRTVFQNRHEKIIHCYEGLDNLVGRGLELAFDFCSSVIWLIKRYPNIIMDGIDICEHLTKIIPYLKEFGGKQIGDFWIGDCQNTGKPDNYYDFINACSIFEHFPDNIYNNVAKECYRILKPGGLMFVYLDQFGPKDMDEQHCHQETPEETRERMKPFGFIPVNNYRYRKL